MHYPHGMVVKRKLGDAATTPAPRSRAGSLRIVDFLALVDAGVRSRLTNARRGVPAYNGWETRQRFGYVQYWRGEHRLHYEAWVQRKTQRLEIGLHFEGDREWSYACAGVLAEHAVEVAAAVGPEWELEEWTPSWTRLHRAFAAPLLTPELAEQAAERVVGLMRGMEPLLVGWGLRS